MHAMLAPVQVVSEASGSASENLFYGLEEDEAKRRLRHYGPNALAQERSRRLGDILKGTLREPMFLLLLAAAGLYLALGDIGEGLFMVTGAVVSIGLVVFQEVRSERALAALREMAEPFSRVIRDGLERRVAARDLVPGDLILVGEGERLPADACLVAGDALVIDESALTGESVPVTKRPQAGRSSIATDPEPGGEHTPFLFAGTLTVRGQGLAVILRTGALTRLGRIGTSLATIETEPTLLQRTTGRLIAKLGIVAFVFCALVVAAYGILRDDWIEGALAGLTLAIALLPEEFPMVLAVFLALGSWRLARHHVLVRRAAVIETLGAASVLCVDKTGTLTENRMAVTTLWRDGASVDVGEDPQLGAEMTGLLRLAALASAPHPVDPMDRAIRHASGNAAALEGPGPLRTYPLRPDLLAFVQVWSEPDQKVMYAAKGAPEAIFRLARLSVEEHQRLDRVVTELARRGLRVLGVASRRQDRDGGEEPEHLAFTFEGLICFLDPVRVPPWRDAAQKR